MRGDPKLHVLEEECDVVGDVHGESGCEMVSGGESGESTLVDDGCPYPGPPHSPVLAGDLVSDICSLSLETVPTCSL